MVPNLALLRFYTLQYIDLIHSLEYRLLCALSFDTKSIAHVYPGADPGDPLPPPPHLVLKGEKIENKDMLIFTLTLLGSCQLFDQSSWLD